MNDILKQFDNLPFDERLDRKLSDPSELKLRNVEAVKIFYCLYGRNAWHATWIQRYSDDCMHLSLESAKIHAESKRVQGSVFYIKELPALQFDAGNYLVLVTQINSSCPLREYSQQAKRRVVANGKTQISNARENYITFGAPMDGVILTFDHDSRFWITPQPSKNSIIILYTHSEAKAEKLKTTELKAWRSSSIGKSYYLSWQQIENVISQRSVLRIRNSWHKKKNVAQQAAKADGETQSCFSKNT